MRGLPGSLRRVPAAVCRSAHVLLHSPRWPRCCLQHTHKRLTALACEAPVAQTCRRVLVNEIALFVSICFCLSSLLTHILGELQAVSVKTGSTTSELNHELCAEFTEMICFMCLRCEQQRVDDDDDDSSAFRLMEGGRSHLSCLPARGPSSPGL